MALRLLLTILIIISICTDLIGQTSKNKVIIIVDVSKLPFHITEKKNNNINLDTELIVSRKHADSSNLNRDTSRLSTTINAKMENGLLKWKFEAENRQTLIINNLFPGRFLLAEPGDSIFISFNDNNYIFSGIGVNKYQVLAEINKRKENIKLPVPPFTKPYARPISVKEYLQLNNYYDEQIDNIVNIIDKSKLKLNKQEYEWIKAYSIYLIEKQRSLAFLYLPKTKEKIKSYHFTHSPEDVARIWDSTMYKPWGKWVRSQNHPEMSLSYIELFTDNEFWSEFNFNMSNDTVSNAASYRKLRYDKIKNNPDYKGLFRERILCYYLDEEVTQELGAWNWFAQSILKDYYSQPGFPVYKDYIRSLETKRQAGGSGGSADAPLFNLVDEDGSSYSYKRIAGKFTVINFWYSGCENCKAVVPALSKLQTEFKNDTNVLFLNVSLDVDKNQWLKHKNAGIYAPKYGVQLFTGGLGKKHEMIKDFDVDVCPKLRYIDGAGKMVVIRPELDLSKDSGKALNDHIRAKMPYAGDGPYVFSKNGGKRAFLIKGNNVEKIDSPINLVSATDLYNKQLKFSLQKQMAVSPSVYPNPSKMLVVSDIEGNFSAFRKLLQANGVIDENFNWSYGKGHLVFAGDMFDRGEQVTECLWLLYSLEEKAKIAGGFVHFIIGNHEIMNLNGRDKYVTKKYKDNYKLLGKTLKEIYDENSELGRWLRTKNIIEKIGDNLFCHGGISSHVNNMLFSLDEINAKIRPYYDKWDEVAKGSDDNLKILFNARKSPFWYRQYYEEDYFSKSNNEMIYHATEEQIDSTCIIFGVNHIITGHTIIADTISIHYGGKVINIDTPHATGKSEALLIEHGAYFRVSNTGNKILLFKDDKHLSNTITNGQISNSQ